MNSRLALLSLLFAAIGLFVAFFHRGAGLIASPGGGTVAIIAIAVSLLSTGAAVTAAAVTAAVRATDKAVKTAPKSALPAPIDAQTGGAAGTAAESGPVKVSITSAKVERLRVGEPAWFVRGRRPATANPADSD